MIASFFVGRPSYRHIVQFLKHVTRFLVLGGQLLQSKTVFFMLLNSSFIQKSERRPSFPFNLRQGYVHVFRAFVPFVSSRIGSLCIL